MEVSFISRLNLYQYVFFVFLFLCLFEFIYCYFNLEKFVFINVLFVSK